MSDMVSIDSSEGSNSMGMDISTISEGSMDISTVSEGNMDMSKFSEGSMDMVKFSDGSVTKFAEGMKFDTTGGMSMEDMVTIKTSEGGN